MAPRYRTRKDYKNFITITDQAVEIKGKGRRKTAGKIVKDAAEELFEKIEKDHSKLDSFQHWYDQRRSCRVEQDQEVIHTLFYT